MLFSLLPHIYVFYLDACQRKKNSVTPILQTAVDVFDKNSQNSGYLNRIKPKNGCLSLLPPLLAYFATQIGLRWQIGFHNGAGKPCPYIGDNFPETVHTVLATHRYKILNPFVRTPIHPITRIYDNAYLQMLYQMSVILI